MLLFVFCCSLSIFGRALKSSKELNLQVLTDCTGISLEKIKYNRAGQSPGGLVGVASVKAAVT